MTEKNPGSGLDELEAYLKENGYDICDMQEHNKSDIPSINAQKEMTSDGTLNKGSVGEQP